LSPDEAERLASVYAERVAGQDREHPGYAGAWHRFAATVLRHGGTHVVPPLRPDPLMELLRTEGRPFPGDAVVQEGAPSDCHRNAVALWRAGTAVAIGTGYALSDDGLWREHSWAVGADGRVIETTEKRIVYFGVVFADERAAWFADWIGGDADAPGAPDAPDAPGPRTA
jgi:hypothetical protein